MSTEEYYVTIHRDGKTGIAVAEYWKAQDRDTFVEIRRDPKSGVVYQEAWFNAKHVLHREGAPAVINRNRVTGKLKSTLWRQNGEKVQRPPWRQMTANPALRGPPGLAGGPQ